VARADGPELEVLLDVLGAANCVRRTAFALARGIAEVADELGRRLARGRAVLACGNGGSAADADHFAAELVGRFSQPRPAFRARSLGGDAATLTALANDFGYAEVFARQVEAWSDEGDALIVMSTSARSPSVVRAAEVARSRRLFVVALTGADPGPLAVLADRVLAVPSTEVAWVQQAHGAILHALCRRIDGTT
jgi:phosphoheptose isomerase